MITLEFTWMVFLGVIAIVALSAYCYIIYRYSKLRKEYDRLEQVVSEQTAHIKNITSTSLTVKAETKQVIHIQSEQLFDTDQISYDLLRDANTVTRLINQSALEIASHMITENCINVDIVPSHNGHKKIVVSADVAQSTENKLHPSAQLLNLLMKNK